MKQEIEAKASEYIELLNYFETRVGSQEVAAHLVGQIGKDTRAAMISSERRNNLFVNGGRAKGPPVTKDQINYMKDLGLVIPDGLTKKEASSMLDEALAAKARG